MRRAIPFAAIAMSLAFGCSAGNPASTGFPSADATSASQSALNGLVASASPGDLASEIESPPSITLPARIGLLFLGYQPVSSATDQQTAMAQFQTALVGANLAKSLVMIPSSLVSATDSIDTIRVLASRFGLDMVVIVSGNSTLSRSLSQPSSFFGQFSTQANVDARVTLDALPVDVLSGRMLAPMEVTGKSGPTLLDPNAQGFSAQETALQGQAELAAFQELETQLLAALQGANAGSSTPSTSPTASPLPSPSPSASP